MYDEMHDTEFPAFRDRVLKAMIQALILLRAENTIRKTPETAPVVFLATIYDSFEAEDLQFRSAQAANPVGIVSEFLSTCRE
jgi:hypothetical protein